MSARAATASSGLDGDDAARVLMVGFSQPHGYALVVQAPGALVAMRADGYPNPEGHRPAPVPVRRPVQRRILRDRGHAPRLHAPRRPLIKPAP